MNCFLGKNMIERNTSGPMWSGGFNCLFVEKIGM